MALKETEVRWRATGLYLPTSVLRSAMIGETRQFLLAYARLGSLTASYQALVDGDLPQRSRVSRVTIAKAIRQRLAGWHPPTWVWDDLVDFARDDHQPSLQAALLLHIVRQDTLLYDFVQQVIVPRWEGGERVVVRGDVQRFLDDSEVEHPEIAGWSYSTRQKVASNALTILRDYGLLVSSSHGSPQKRIVEPAVPSGVACHLVRLLRAEGVVSEEMADHSDWRIWLWDRQRARAAIAASAEVRREDQA